MSILLSTVQTVPLNFSKPFLRNLQRRLRNQAITFRPILCYTSHNLHKNCVVTCPQDVVQDAGYRGIRYAAIVIYILKCYLNMFQQLNGIIKG